MAKQGFKVIDSEPHFLEPHDLWERYLEEPWRSNTKLATPASGRVGEGRTRFQMEGVEQPPIERDPVVTRRGDRRIPKEPHLARVTERPEPDLFLEGFDIEGIDVGVLMPTTAMSIVRYDGLNPEHSLALCRVYNDYAHRFVQTNQQRLKFWAWLPPHDASLAAGEARRCVEELGATGVAMTGGAVNGHLLSDAVFDPLWRELDRLRVPFGLHGPPPSHQLKDNISHRYRGHRAGRAVAMVLGNPFHAQTELTELILGGVLECHPSIKVVVMEVDATWLCWLLWRMDEKWEMHQPELEEEVALSMRPSEYFRRQCYAEIEAEEHVAKYVVDYVGPDNFLFSTDYPHSDSLFPHAIDTFLALEGISDEAKRKVLWDNPARLFGIATP